MTPKPQMVTVTSPSSGKSVKFSRIHPESDGDEIVISGMSGKFPNARNIGEFEYNLYNKIDMVDEAETRWKHDNPEIPRRSGKIPDLTKFDSTFFGVHTKQANSMDPQLRIVIEVAYEAVIDAGVNPTMLRGSRTGVFIGACISEAEKEIFTDDKAFNGFGMTGCSRAMLANRISYILGCNGPSFVVDTACSSSMTALDCAFSAFRSGEIDAAIVGGCNLALHPFVTLQFAKLGVLAKNGYCRPFDKDASGYTRAEAIACIYLQKKRDAKRVYGSLLYSQVNCDGYKSEGITFPSGKIQEKLLRDFYNSVDITPSDLGYMEAHSTGTLVGDPEECRAIDNVLCAQRSAPLLVGSVKSNIGHTEPSSGVCSIIKVLFTFQNRKIPPNINFNAPRPGISSLEEGRLKVVVEPTDLCSPYVGVNSFGFGGGNAHILLKACEKVKDKRSLLNENLPSLVNWSGRTEAGVEELFRSLENRPIDPEHIALLHNIQSKGIPGFVFRGFAVYDNNEANMARCVQKTVQHFSGIKRPIVWVFSGMGSQWTGMGTALMQIPLFKESIMKSHNTLAQFGVDLVQIITSPDPHSFDNILHSFVGIAAIQIALVDILRALNLEPDLIIGHSVGELGCAYGDGVFTAEQMILAAYYRGKVSVETESIRGSMAAIGLGYEEIRKIIPETIEVACHNAYNSSTISGPVEDVKQFVKELTDKGIFAREVPTSNIAYHSRYISHFGPTFLENLRKVIPNPKKRSSKWLSSSIPYEKWNEPESQLSSAEYHTNNLLGSVLFEETAKHLPEDCLTIEIAPHGLLQAILKKIAPNGVHIGLTHRTSKNPLVHFFSALGSLYTHGIDFPIERLYPKVQWPVSQGTPSISNLIRWDHSVDWYTPEFSNGWGKEKGERIYKISLQNETDEYLAGHTIDGKVLVPATFYLQCVWDTFSRMHFGPFFDKISVEFENVKFLQATTLTEDNTVELNVMVHYATGNFEITHMKSQVVTGTIRTINKDDKPPKSRPIPDSKFPLVCGKDFYNELKLRGYHYSGVFRGVNEARGDGLCGKIEWNKNWVTFMDCMLQVHIIGRDSRSLMIPTRIRKLRISPDYHNQVVDNIEGDVKLVDVVVNTSANRVVAGGVEMCGLQASAIQRKRPPVDPVLERYQFVPHEPKTTQFSVPDAVRIIVQLALENNPTLRMKVVEQHSKSSVAPIIEHFQHALDDLPVISGEYFLLSSETFDLPGIQVEPGQIATQSDCYIAIDSNILGNSEFASRNEAFLKNVPFVLSREDSGADYRKFKAPVGFTIISVLSVESETLVLLRKTNEVNLEKTTCVKVSSNDMEFSWITELKTAMTKGPVVLVAQNEKFNGLLGFVNCMRREPNGQNVRCVFIDDEKAPTFDLGNAFYAEQLKLDLAMNVLREGQWGGYRHLQLQLNIPSAPREDHIYANVIHRGDLSSLRWFDGPLPESKHDVKIVYSALNFRDVMFSTGRLAVEVFGDGRLTQSCVLGFEYSGIESKTGRPVMGMAVKGCVGSFTELTKKLVWYVPKKWTLKEAATIPVVYVTVYYAFFVVANIRKGKSILIHAGTGGIGLSAIRVALAYGLEVFTTVSTAEKKQFLLSQFPQLKESHIGNSRDTSFEAMVQEQTDGKGVDFVLNSLSEEKLLASIRCLGKGGRFLEIGKFDMANNNAIGLGDFLKELTFHAVLADNLFDADDDLVEELRALIDKDIERDIIKPLPATVFQADELEQAFRYLAGGKHMGKVLIQVRENEESKATLPIKVIPLTYFDSELVYVIPGGLGGFGVELADWMIVRGARKMVLSSSRGISKDYQRYRIALWESYGCEVVISTADITTQSGCNSLLQDSMNLGPIGGIFNLAVSLQDGLFENQTVEKFRASFAPKATATQHLDQLSRQLCPKLKYFVVFSSVSCGRGNAGQTNYGMSNSVMERIIEDRVANGLPGKAIQWGAVGEVGLVAMMAEERIDVEIGGTLQQRISSCLFELDTLLHSPDPIVSSMVVADKRSTRGSEATLVETVMNIMGIKDLKSISLGTPLAEMGMDSLMAVEIKQSLERDFDLSLTPQDLRTVTFQKLQEYSANGISPDNATKSANGNDKNITDNIVLLWRNIGEETTASVPLLKLETKDAKANCNSSIILPGIEALSGNFFRELAKKLNWSTHVLQYHHTAKFTTIQEIAAALMEDIKPAVQFSRQFYLVGYSFGSLVTLQIASQLEQQGFTGKVLLIDGSPLLMNKFVTSMFPEDSDEGIYETFISDIITKVFKADTPENLQKTLADLTIEEKIETFLKFVQLKTSYTKENSRLWMDGIFNRIKISKSEQFADFKPIAAPITLVKCTESTVLDIPDDYGLVTLTTGGVDIKKIDGNHATILDNDELADIINEFNPLVT